MVGRPIGITKDPNRRRVKNPVGRMIDYEGNQYNKLICNGYKLNNAGTQLIIDKRFTGERNAKKPVGRSTGKSSLIPAFQKVKNPKTGRMINRNAKGNSVLKQL